MKRLFLILAVAVCAFSVVGCAADQIQEARKVYAATTQLAADLEAEIVKLPPGDPLRKALEDKLARVNEHMPKVRAIIDASEKGEFGPDELKELSTLPVVGPYVGIIALFGTLIYKGIKEAQAKRALKQVVTGIENVLPIKTPEQKLMLDAAQDESTKALVKLAKGE